MAEFREIAHGFNRMCNSYSNPPCEGCPMEIYGIDLDTCRARLIDNPDKYEERILKWIKEHPSPIYPTWWEYLRAYSVTGANIPDSAVIYKLKNWRIPADIAQKLGIEPKEE